MNARAMKRLNLGLPNDPFHITTSTFQATIDYHQRILVLDSTSAITVSLPKANGSGCELTFILAKNSAGVASNIIKRNPSTDIIQGSIAVNLDASTAEAFKAASTSNTVTLNGTTTGGVATGDTLFFFDIAAGVWVVTGSVIGSGSIATPFSNT